MSALTLRASLPTVLLLLASMAAAEPAITPSNWLQHPQIKEVRALYQSVEHMKETGRLMRRDRKWQPCPQGDARRSLYIDPDERPRLYYYEGGSDDSAVQRALYYDERGTLRFAFIQAGAINGTAIEHRVYFSNTGTRLWEIQKRLKGPGYTFPNEWPDTDLTRAPLQAFNDTNPCP